MWKNGSIFSLTQHSSESIFNLKLALKRTSCDSIHLGHLPHFKHFDDRYKKGVATWHETHRFSFMGDPTLLGLRALVAIFLDIPCYCSPSKMDLISMVSPINRCLTWLLVSCMTYDPHLCHVRSCMIGNWMYIWHTFGHA